MEAYVYGVVADWVQVSEVRAVFPSEERAQQWIEARGRDQVCFSCDGLGKDGASACWVCGGTGVSHGDGERYEVVALPWNPSA